MPAWIHGRAEHILAKNPSMKKSTAFAIATQQSHKTGKTPKGYGTKAGKREAKAKYDQPKKEYVKGANPGDLETPKLSDKPKTRWTGSRLVEKKAVVDAFSDEFKKLAKNLMPMLAKPKLKPTQANSPNPTFRVKESDAEDSTLYGDETEEKVGFATSQYSGTLGGMPRQQPQQLPGWVEPPTTTKVSTPPKVPMPGKVQTPRVKTSSIVSPAGQLAKAQKVGKLKTTAPPGPSIAQVTKPIGFGRVMPGAAKNTI